ncbi:hypothetical protein CYB_0222 [Synechococcus sp. JA-2-3B'a(2-13)]|nr:hypothetical protein CYB_0222 [Synechococcus sp. JA-2-3B'a(2-13)]
MPQVRAIGTGPPPAWNTPKPNPSLPPGKGIPLRDQGAA